MKKAKSIKKAAPKKGIKKTPRKGAALKTMNDNSMTVSAFFGMIRSMLRRKAMYVWKPIKNVKEAAKIPYKGINKRRKFSYICSGCLGEFDGKSVAIHHKIECGSLKSFDDLGGFCERLFCTEEHLILLCDCCHTTLHKKEKE